MQAKYVFIFIAACMSVLPLSADQANNENPKIVVKGEATLYQEPDQVQITIGVVSQDKDLDKALHDNSTKMERLIEDLNRLGIMKSEYKTAHFNIQPIYQSPPKHPDVNWQPTINYYQVANSLIVTTQQLNLVSKLITEAAQAGANKIENIHFDLKDPRKFREEAIAAATQNAIADADILAKTANVKITGIRVIHLDPAQNYFSAPRSLMIEAFASKSANRIPIEPGQLEVRASVEMTFDINP